MSLIAGGSRIEAGQDAGGFRDFLEGEPIHAGDPIELWLAGRWLPGRYEAEYQTGCAHFYTTLFDQQGDSETTISINRQVMRFRWPTRMDESLDAKYTRIVQQNRQHQRAWREAKDIINRALADREEGETESAEVEAERLRYVLEDLRSLAGAVLRG